MRLLVTVLFLNLMMLASPSAAENHIADGDTAFTDDFPMEEPILVPAMDFGDDRYSETFRIAMEDHAIAVLNWQLRTSERILLMVMLLTAAGVLFAGYQLWHAMNPRFVTKKPEGDATRTAASDTNSTLSFGDGKFEVTSPMVGIAILVISLGALYFFLTFVYAIEVMPIGAI